MGMREIFRQAYQEEMEVQLSRWLLEIDQWQTSCRKTRTPQREALSRQVDMLAVKVANATLQLERLKQATGDTWEYMQVNIERLWSDVQESVEAMRSIWNESPGNHLDD